MIMAGYTTTEQSRKLIELGIDVNTADMFYDNPDLLNNPPEIIVNHNYPFNDSDIPCWSTEALMKLLPRNIYTKDNFVLNDIQAYKDNYRISYTNLSCYEYKDVIECKYDTLIECAYNMIVKLKEMRLL